MPEDRHSERFEELVETPRAGEREGHEEQVELMLDRLVDQVAEVHALLAKEGAGEARVHDGVSDAVKGLGDVIRTLEALVPAIRSHTTELAHLQEEAWSEAVRFLEDGRAAAEHARETGRELEAGLTRLLDRLRSWERRQVLLAGLQLGSAAMAWVLLGMAVWLVGRAPL